MQSVNVISYMSGYQYFIYERFVGSLYDTGFTGNVYLIVQQKDEYNIKKLQKKYKNVFYVIDRISNFYAANIRRYIIIEEIVGKLNNENKPDYILICDGRDVLFQKNLEDFDFKHDIYFAEEKIVFTQCANYNSRWLLELEKVINEKFFNDIKNNNVLCSGTTIGNYNSMKKYLNIMCHIIKNYNLSRCHHGLDQGIHNYLYYTNKYKNIIDDIKIVKNSDGFIGTIGAALTLNIKNLSTFIIKDGKIYDNTNEEEKLYYAVHQWDRLCDKDREKISVKYNFIKTA